MDKAALLASARQIPPPGSETARMLERCADRWTAELTARLRARADLDVLVGSGNLPLMENNHANHFRYLAGLADLFDPLSFVETVIWVFRTYRTRGFSPDYWRVMLPEARTLLGGELPADARSQLTVFHDWLIDHLPTLLRVSDEGGSFYESLGFPEAAPSLSVSGGEGPRTLVTGTAGLASSYLDLLLEGRREEAVRLLTEAVNDGVPVTTLYLEVLQPVMYEVGRLWQTNRIDIGTEHYCTAVTQVLMARLFSCTLAGQRQPHRLIGCCVGSELHELGLRMVCDVFEAEGWDTCFLGASTPAAAVLQMVAARPADLLCLSVTLGAGVSEARALIRAIRDQFGAGAPKIMVGGLPFLLNPELGDRVGADATARDARVAVELATQLVTGTGRRCPY